jgi:Putative serine dehydratase domain
LVEGDEPATNRAIVDAGLKTLAFDSGDSGPPRAFDEHRRAVTNRFGLGDKIRLGPCYCDPTVNPYDRSAASATTASSGSARSPLRHEDDQRYPGFR